MDVTKIRDAARRAAELAQALEQVAEAPPTFYDGKTVDRVARLAREEDVSTDVALGELLSLPMEGERRVHEDT